MIDGVATRFTTNAGIDTMAVWSGDGSRLAYVSSRNGKNDIYTINTDGTNDAPLTDSTKVFGTPSWR